MTETKRGRSKFLMGNWQWLNRTLSNTIDTLEPGDKISIEIYRYLKPDDKYGITIRPGKDQESTYKRLTEKE